jgi:S1-C subfamily serine protease
MKLARIWLAGISLAILPTLATRAYGALGVSVQEAPGFCVIHSHWLPGLQVNAITPGSAAQALGLQPGDVILEINGFRVTTYSQMTGITFSTNGPFQGWMIRNGIPQRFGGPPTGGPAY